MAYHHADYLKCIEPAYIDFMDPMASRRMSRIVKMGVCAALKCLRDAGIDNPGAIVTGTGLGCIADTEKFLGSLYANEEKLLNPTPFIQSTHNTVAAAIALMLKCKNYNNTFVHRGFSFEDALLDGLMLLQEHSASNVLVGGLDELTDHSYTITSRLGLWKKQSLDNLRLLDYKDDGSLPGEGVAFFLLSESKSEKSLAKINAVSTFYKPDSHAEAERKIQDFVSTHLGDIANVDFVITGMNGDRVADEVYHHLGRTLFSRLPCGYYKHLCGEYDTSSSFALYLASMILKTQQVPVVLKCDDKPVGKMKNILIYNHLRSVNHGIFLVSTC
ncbi:MAG: beta-ketoacyl synthase chain length factor [Bacteroidales bacterium]|nr:beta-ketoacyl synthase chain length factor [Bacteroidales bacterium]